MSAVSPKESSRTQHLGRWACEQGIVPARIVSLLVIGLSLAGCRTTPQTSSPSEGAPKDVRPVPEDESLPLKQAGLSQAATVEPGQTVSLFDGNTLGLWNVTDFGGQGKVYVRDGAVHMERGNNATGITWSGPVVRMNYEITLDAMRVEGTDFFCALTFPVEENPCTLVLGGWGGSLCGLSSLDYRDASENETTTFVGFERGRWYHVRLRVTPNRIQAWLDDKALVDVDTTGHRIGIRVEMDPCVPLGIATWVTTGAVRDITLTKLADSAGR